MHEEEPGCGVALLALAVLVVCYIGLPVVAIAVAIHFIRKYW